jgi:hypothetical protein
MKIFNKIFGSKRPVLPKEDISNIEKVMEYILWFIKNEPITNVISFPSSNIIFNEGFRPISEEYNDPYSINKDISNLIEWFVIKMYLDLNHLCDASKDEFRIFIDFLDDQGTETLKAAGEISVKYDLNFENFIYKVEIDKISDENDKEIFKQNYLADNVIGAEIRILAWLYYEYFNEKYAIRKK